MDVAAGARPAAYPENSHGSIEWNGLLAAGNTDAPARKLLCVQAPHHASNEDGVAVDWAVVSAVDFIGLFYGLDLAMTAPDDPEPKWGWPAAFWFAATLVFLTWLVIWRVVSWVLS